MYTWMDGWISRCGGRKRKLLLISEVGIPGLCAAEGILGGGEGTDGRRDFGFSGEGFGKKGAKGFEKKGIVRVSCAHHSCTLTELD